MAKNFRFLKLVEQCGNPEIITLWTAPKRMPALQKAIVENRVLTIFHPQSGSKKEFGHIGFHQQRAASYLMFPKRLPKALPEAVVIGIRYDLLKETEPTSPAEQSLKPAARRRRKPVATMGVAPATKAKAPKPKTKKFEVVVSKTAIYEIKMLVSAVNIAEAEAKALRGADAIPFKPQNIKAEVKSIAEA